MSGDPITDQIQKEIRCRKSSSIGRKSGAGMGPYPKILEYLNN
jgi:hypothetical protein